MRTDILSEKPGKTKKALYPGPNCVLKLTDLGIAVGSAVKTAGIHNVDNRIMFSAGVVALQSGMLNGCSVTYGIPLKASGRNIFWDMKFLEHQPVIPFDTHPRVMAGLRVIEGQR